MPGLGCLATLAEGGGDRTTPSEHCSGGLHRHSSLWISARAACNRPARAPTSQWSCYLRPPRAREARSASSRSKASANTWKAEYSSFIYVMKLCLSVRHQDRHSSSRVNSRRPFGRMLAVSLSSRLLVCPVLISDLPGHLRPTALAPSSEPRCPRFRLPSPHGSGRCQPLGRAWMPASSDRS